MRQIALFLLLIPSGCSDEKSVAHYKRYPEERAVRLRECVKAQDTSQDCRNIKQAEFETLGIPSKDGKPIG